MGSSVKGTGFRLDEVAGLSRQRIVVPSGLHATHLTIATLLHGIGARLFIEPLLHCQSETAPIDCGVMVLAA